MVYGLQKPLTTATVLSNLGDNKLKRVKKIEKKFFSTCYFRFAFKNFEQKMTCKY